MIFDALKILKVVNKTGLLVEELHLLQCVYDYQYNVAELNVELKTEIEKNYIKYFKQAQMLKGEDVEIKIPWKQIINKLIKEGWLEDARKDKNKFSLNELYVGLKFQQELGTVYTDEELLEQLITIYPTYYSSQGKGGMLPNFNFSAKEEKEIFTAFKKLLAGNKKENWAELEYITKAMFENLDYSILRFDRYVNTFKANLSEYKKLI